MSSRPALQSNVDLAVRACDLGKSYAIYATPRDRLKQLLVPHAQRLLGRPQSCYFREFWALRDVSFDVKRGETVGVIGRNGSGKSTLLQVLCGTLAPTLGSVETRGRVAALLELGAGFNPEFTGRENVYLSAALLGLDRATIDARFHSIAAFAGIGPFIEQPVKTYSSGMYVRLAFAVVAHVDADVLVVDEALSVGDALFTQKCMRFIREFQERGTLIFVSHDLGAVQALCETCLWLDGGRVRARGPARPVVEAYLQHTLQELYGPETRLQPIAPSGEREASSCSASGADARLQVRDNVTRASGWRTGVAELLSVSFEHRDPGADGAFAGGERVRLVLRARASEPLEQPILGFLVRDRLGQDLFGENTLGFTAAHPRRAERGQELRAEFCFELPLLPNGEYAVMASIADGDLHRNIQHHWLNDALVIKVSSSQTRYGLVGIPFEHVAMEVL